MNPHQESGCEESLETRLARLEAQLAALRLEIKQLQPQPQPQPQPQQQRQRQLCGSTRTRTGRPCKNPYNTCQYRLAGRH